MLKRTKRQVLQYALSRYVYNRSLFDIFTSLLFVVTEILGYVTTLNSASQL